MITISSDSFYQEAWRYGVKHLFWRPVLKNHHIVLRVERDEETGEIQRYDVVVDNVTGPDAKSIDRLIQDLKKDPYLKWIGFILEKHIRLRRLIR